MTMIFKDLPLLPAIQAVLDAKEFSTPTEIQAKIIPMLLERPHVDVHGQAQTGTGKTLAFGIPMLHRITVEDKHVQALVVAPTRELAVQIYENLQPFAKACGLYMTCIYGGVSMEEQVRTLRRGVHIVIGTPGRLNDHLRRNTLDISRLKTMVLDEADIMLDMGFREEVDELLDRAHPDREIWLFSATVKSGISDLMNEHMKDTVSIRVSRQAVGNALTKQYFVVLPHGQRLGALARFIEAAAAEFYGFIFCQTKVLTSEVADQLTKRGYRVGALHGDMSQAQRNAMIKKFREGDLKIIVATDVAARGIDISGLTHVVNFSLPEDHESYVHRVGRTGRAGKEGIAITFINRSEVRLLDMIKRKFSVVIESLDIPTKSELLARRIEKAQEYLTSVQEHAADRYTPALRAVVDTMSPEALKAVVLNSMNDLFIKGLEQEEDITAQSATSSRSSSSVSGVQELSLAVGSDDGIDRDDVIAFLTNGSDIKAEDITKIRVIRRRTFVEMPTDAAVQAIDRLRFASLGGRKARPSLVDEREQRQGGGHERRGGNGGFRGRREGGYERRGGNGGFRGRREGGYHERGERQF